MEYQIAGNHLHISRKCNAVMVDSFDQLKKSIYRHNIYSSFIIFYPFAEKNIESEKNANCKPKKREIRLFHLEIF